MVKLLRERATMNSFDKSANPLITVPGSPGIGKSTFLNNFPNSVEYVQYAKSRWVEEPIVAPVTFNSEVWFSKPNIPALGLRMLYGSAAVMTL